MSIAQQTVGTTATTIYTSTGGTVTTAIFFMNDNISSRVLNVYVVPSGDSPAASTQIIKNLTVDGEDTYILNLEKLILDDGDTIQATSSIDATSIYATTSYVGI